MIEKKIDELQTRVNLIHGAERIGKQHASGKLSAWERIMLLVDEGSFVETNVFLEHRCSYFGMDKRKQEGDGVITGYGMVNGRTICIYAQDFTVFGGSISEMNARKISDIQKKALDMLVPIVGLFDSGGARVQEGIQGLSGHGHIFYNNVKSSGRIPQISAIMGTCAGGASYSPALTDFIIMVDKTNMFITGPKVVKAAIGQDVSMDDLGGTQIHSQISGMADHITKNDADCIAYVKELLSYLPDSYMANPPQQIHYQFNLEKKNQIQEIVPQSGRIAYDVRKVIECIVDDGSIMEIKKDFATNIITLLARMEGQTIGVVANQSSQKAGCIDIDAADKAARFVRLCDNYNIPILNLVDVSGFYPGKEQEQKGIIRHGAKMLFAYSEAEVLKITVILRKAYGGAYLAMCSKELGADMVFSWPNAEMAVMSAEAAINVLYRNIDDNEKELRVAEYKEQFLNPYEAAHMGYIDEVIDPCVTREKICRVLRTMGGHKQNRGRLPHGNIPL